MSNQPTNINLIDIMKTALQGNKFAPLNNFVSLHDVERHDDGAGNDDKLYKADNINYIERFPERHGFDDGIDKEIYDKYNPDVDEHVRAARLNALNAMHQLWQQHSAQDDD